MSDKPYRVQNEDASITASEGYSYKLAPSFLKGRKLTANEMSILLSVYTEILKERSND